MNVIFWHLRLHLRFEMKLQMSSLMSYDVITLERQTEHLLFVSDAGVICVFSPQTDSPPLSSFPLFSLYVYETFSLQ